MLQTLSRNLKLIMGWAVILALLSGIASLFFPKQYSADAQVLIISRDRAGVDPYTQAKSAERIGENLAQIMKTTDFYGKVFESGVPGVDADKWKNLSERKQRKKWKKDVQGSMVYGSGLLNVRAYGKSREEATALSLAVSQTLAGRGWEYVGGDVALKVVTTPLPSRLPARPNMGVNAVVGFLAGALVSGLWIVKTMNRRMYPVAGDIAA